VKTVFRQAALVLVLGSLLSLAANAVSPRGLKLTTDYFPAAKAGPGARLGTLPPPATAGTDDSFASVAERLRTQGLQALDHPEVAALFHSPDFAAQKVVFVDARNDQHYQAGHVPGAWQFDHYHPAQHIAAVLPACLLAEKVVVYCTGGNCEDSEFAARMLTQSSVPAQKLFIYPGGITEWQTRGQPLETGPRGSGVLLPAKP